MPLFDRHGQRAESRDEPPELRDYQEQGWKAFLENGAVGIFWPYGQGKTVIGCHAIASLKGRKLIVVPTRTLVEQWEKHCRDFGFSPIACSGSHHGWTFSLNIGESCFS